MPAITGVRIVFLKVSGPMFLPWTDRTLPCSAGSTPGCGCTDVLWDSDPIPPGGEGHITLVVDLKDKRGLFDTSATVTTNRAGLESFDLHVQGEAKLDRILEEEDLHLGRLKPNDTRTSYLLLHNPGSTEFVIEETKLTRALEPDEAGRETLALNATIAWQPWEKASEFEGVPAPLLANGEPGDLIVRVNTEVPSDAPPGPFTLTLGIEANSDDSRARLNVRVTGTVESLIDVAPEVIYILVSNQSQLKVTREITFGSEEPLSIRSVQVMNGAEFLTAQRSGDDTVTLVYDPRKHHESNHAGHIVCEFDTGERIRIPIHITKVNRAPAGR